ncbi:MAG: ribose transport system substrate-binding protein [Microbacteriaceae bacterium]|nr:ribose transport system substrate-binding protein [Microbacteriaceae bacterium]
MKRRGKLILIIAAAVALAGCTPVQKPADSSTNKAHGFTSGISLYATLHGQQGCQDLIAAHPDIKVIYSESHGMSVGCIQASNIGDIKVVGNGGSTDGLKLVASGGMPGTTCYGPGSLAAQVVQMAHAYLAGDKAVRGN